jgi:hypothetical protein
MRDVGNQERLWVAALMNILVGSMSLAALGFLTFSSRVPEAFQVGAGSATVAALSTGMLIAWSVLALMGKTWARHLMLAAALLFYGGIAIQNIQLYLQADDAQLAALPFVAHIVRSTIEIAINLWALLSAKTRRYFEQASGAA